MKAIACMSDVLAKTGFAAELFGSQFSYNIYNYYNLEIVSLFFCRRNLVPQITICHHQSC